ncbi:hypothetical protein T265_02507 [Opisthorchis viverrini]|uniref:Uncharacterized protein n=1 Tax=Opisthorchis viverrini TaxID=6198 RepID=A0A074ZVQ8_OPIVI|nr:hypothetical protein T265_02507 [Opisthorchis viverrini]KER31181.1 hypothetical protein T265_02507 [Opisthorchis viverrini]
MLAKFCQPPHSGAVKYCLKLPAFEEPLLAPNKHRFECPEGTKSHHSKDQGVKFMDRSHAV